MQLKEEIFCPKCKKFCKYTVKNEEETYPVMVEENITIVAKVSYCSCCGEQLWNDELEDENLNKAFKAYNLRHIDESIPTPMRLYDGRKISRKD